MNFLFNLLMFLQFLVINLYPFRQQNIKITFGRQSLTIIIQMSSLLPFQGLIGLSMSIVCLALSPLIAYFQNTLSHSLVLAQMLIIFQSVYAAESNLFTSNLKQAQLSFIPSILKYCSSQNFQCVNSSLMTVVIIWTSLIILVWIIVRIVSIKKPEATYKPFYDFLKGIFRWTIIPFFYSAVTKYCERLFDQDYHYDYYFSLAIIIFYALVIAIQFLCFKCSESKESNSWKKWLQLLIQLKIGCYAFFVSMSHTYRSVFRYLLYAPNIIYFIFHMAKYNYSYKIFQKVFLIIQESIFITIYSLFIFKSKYVEDYLLDFFALALSLLLEIILLILRIKSRCTIIEESNGKIVNDYIDEKKGNTKQLQQQNGLAKAGPQAFPSRHSQIHLTGHSAHKLNSWDQQQ